MDMLDVTVDSGCGGFVEEEVEDACIDIIIDEDDAVWGFLNEFFEEDEGIEHLIVEEDALALCEGAVIETVKDVVDLIVGGYLLELYGFESLEDGCIGNDELAHGVEGIINADGHLNGYIGTEDG